jgi:hypothetical protein
MTERHESCCAVYNEPAYPNGPCDCKFRELNETVGEFPFKTVSVGSAAEMPEEAVAAFVEACMISDQ